MNVLAFPETECGVARVRLMIERVDYAAPEASGRQGGVQAGWPLWSASYQLDRMDGVSGDLFRAFFDRLRGRQRLFLGGDPARPFPRIYPGGFTGMLRAGGGAFDGSATGWTQASDSDGQALIGLTGLPAGLQLKAGDLIGWKWDNADLAPGNLQRRAMVRVVAEAAASGAGAISVLAEPPIDTSVVPVGAVAHLDRPACLMRLIPDNSDLGAVGGGGASEGGTIAAAQELRP